MTPAARKNLPSCAAAKPRAGSGRPSSNPAAADAPPARRAVTPPARVHPNMSLFEYLSQCQPPLHRKIIDIALSQTGVPPELRSDAAQEILVMWATQKPDTKRFKPGQIASYAHRMAKHAALRLRRELGSSVRLPGSAFRKRKDGSSYVTPGVLASPVPWDDLEEWMDAELLVESGQNPALPQHLSLDDLLNVPAEQTPDDEDAQMQERLALLDQRRDQLSERQYAILRALVQGRTYEEIERQEGVKRGVLMREIAIAAAIVGAPD